MQFGDFFGDADYPVGAELFDDFVGEFINPVAALVEREGELELTIFFKESAAGGGFRDEKTGEQKSVGGQSAGAENRHYRTRTGHGDNGEVAPPTGTDDTKSGVADGGRAGVGDDGDGFTSGYQIGEFFGDFDFVVIVVGEQVASQPKAGEQAARCTGVLAGNEVDGAEDGPSALGEVGEVADGCCHHVEVASQGRERGVGGSVGHGAVNRHKKIRPERGRICNSDQRPMPPIPPMPGMPPSQLAGRLHGMVLSCSVLVEQPVEQSSAP